MRNEDLRAFAEAEGGYWSETGDGEAVIERGDARVFIGVVENAEDALPDDVEFAVAKLGRMPKSMLSIRIGHAAASRALAEEITARAVSRWSGFVDLNEPLTRSD